MWQPNKWIDFQLNFKISRKLLVLKNDQFIREPDIDWQENRIEGVGDKEIGNHNCIMILIIDWCMLLEAIYYNLVEVYEKHCNYV